MRIFAAIRKNEKAAGIILRYNDFLGSAKYDEDDPCPVIRYTTASGKLVTETYFASSKYFTVGDKVTVYYNPANPKRFIIGGWSSILTPGIMVLFGIFSIILAFHLHNG